MFLQGDINCVSSEEMDRLRMQGAVRSTGVSPLAKICTEFGWKDIWRMQNPEARKYSCWNKTSRTLSRIDTCIGNPQSWDKISQIPYLTRCLSDHAAIEINIITGGLPLEGLLKINAHWFTLIDNGGILKSLVEYFRNNWGTASDQMVWEAGKAFLRGELIRAIKRKKREFRSREEELRKNCLKTEEQQVRNPTEEDPCILWTISDLVDCFNDQRLF
ncbi:uncharacterized protein LOC130358074 [Hyla sarda]|uniref:uncharacterized protein LOC130358074 n=1 Tax=Hyla sarda TaxID=327740 RepID=UPI0024C44473|nr:uncharacterized protein LOC130358074 [Hyla sarda]